jgi:hypothetical protein
MIAAALCAVCAALVCARPQTAQQNYPFQDPNKSVEERVNNIVSLMTLEEKINVLGTDAFHGWESKAAAMLKGSTAWRKADRRSPAGTANIPCRQRNSRKRLDWEKRGTRR